VARRCLSPHVDHQSGDRGWLLSIRRSCQSLSERLVEQGVTLVEVPDDEFKSIGANVLAIAPRRCVMMAGNPITRARLKAAGAQVLEYEGSEISLKGGGGPTCLTRPLQRRM
jgi:arginine deiminase